MLLVLVPAAVLLLLAGLLAVSLARASAVLDAQDDAEMARFRALAAADVTSSSSEADPPMAATGT